MYICAVSKLTLSLSLSFVVSECFVVAVIVMTHRRNGSLCHDQCLAIQLSFVAEAVCFLDNMNVSVSDFAVWSYYF